MLLWLDKECGSPRAYRGMGRSLGVRMSRSHSIGDRLTTKNEILKIVLVSLSLFIPLEDHSITICLADRFWVW